MDQLQQAQQRANDLTLQAEVDRLRGQLDLVRYYAPLAYKMATNGAATLPVLDRRLAMYAAGVTAVRTTLEEERSAMVSRLMMGQNWTRKEWIEFAGRGLALANSTIEAMHDKSLFPPV